MRLLLVSTAVAPLGHGKAGGVGDTVPLIAHYLEENGHRVHVLCPEGSKSSYSIHLIEIEGSWAEPAQETNYKKSSCTTINNYLHYIREHQEDYDVIVNFSYDAELYIETDHCKTPLLHYVSMSAIPHMKTTLFNTVQKHPRNIAFLTNAQKNSYTLSPVETPLLFKGIPVDRYIFSETPNNYMTWANRIAPEKGLEDACELARQTTTPLKIAGYMENKAYYDSVIETYPDIEYDYCGYLNQADLQKLLSKSLYLVITNKWIEAFGKIVIESLACGTPVIAYNKGGPAEIIEDKKTGFLVKDNCINSLIAASKNIHNINRAYCREYAEQHFNMTPFIKRIESWLHLHVGPV